jgi:hypothetical protein
MKRFNRSWILHVVSALTGLMLIFQASPGQSANEIVLGAATSLTFLEGRESLNAVELAVEQINAGGGVRVGDKRLPLRIVPLDLQGARPGVPYPMHWAAWSG